MIEGREREREREGIRWEGRIDKIGRMIGQKGVEAHYQVTELPMTSAHSYLDSE